MIKPYISVVIGKGFGDEGKGMATDYLSSRYEKVLVVRHNGGAQSGHTVELPDKRFVFHELSSGSFRMADTFWADTYYPDLFKLGEEIEEFRGVISGGDVSESESECDVEKVSQMPAIFADINTQVTIIDDVLINMAAETMRGEERHGSCGMGIYEALCRGEAGYGITIGELQELDFDALLERLEEIRREYVPRRLSELGFDKAAVCKNSCKARDVSESYIEYLEMLEDRIVLENVARVMLENMSHVNPIENVKELFNKYDSVIFENGQGLLLDTDNEEYSPHVTASKTGLYNPYMLLRKIGYSIHEVVYVTRTYVTRHGAGPLPNECDRRELGIKELDITNIHNPWQGSIRYARHNNIEDFDNDIKADMKILQEDEYPTKCMLMITHLDETSGNVLCVSGNVEVEEFCKIFKRENEGVFDGYYLSWSRYGGVEIK